MATDFFDQQQVARKKTSLLLTYFSIAAVLIVLTVYCVVSAMVVLASNQQPPSAQFWDWERGALVTVCVAVVIVSGSLFKMATLRQGGSAVARLVGGEAVNPNTTDLAQRRLLNVVEEMALASGTPVPTVYVLPHETSINAFAAGHDPGDAVIVVSPGCLDYLTRDELQGVVAHEFSHILNGDMRLNLRLIGLLHGILLIALIGYIIVRAIGSSPRTTRSSNKKDNSAAAILAILAFGVALIVIGYVGVFFGRLIKSAVSRQREFLADASAVQFTRNPDGITGALKKIGGLTQGSRIENPNAEQASHLFFGPGVAFWFEAFSTHPPLVERIRRIDASFDGHFHATKPLSAAEADQGKHAAADQRGGGPAAASRIPTGNVWDRRGSIPLNPVQAITSIGATSVAHMAYASALLATLPEPLTSSVREPFAARALVYALLLDDDLTIRQTQLALLEDQSEPGTGAETMELLPSVAALGDDARLPLAELAMPALRQLSLRQYQLFRARSEALIQADQRVSLFEFALKRMLLRHLDQHFEARRPATVRYEALEPVRGSIELLLSALARLGDQDEERVALAFRQGAGRLAPLDNAVLLSANDCALPAVDAALDQLASASPAIKKQVLDACATCITSDGRITVAEGELLRAIADSLDCPMPPLIAGIAHGPSRTEETKAGQPSALS